MEDLAGQLRIELGQEKDYGSMTHQEKVKFRAERYKLRRKRMRKEKRNFYWDESETLIEEKGDKYRIIDHENGFKQWCGFQAIKEDDKGEYLSNKGEKWYILSYTWGEPMTKDEAEEFVK